MESFEKKKKKKKLFSSYRDHKHKQESTINLLVGVPRGSTVRSNWTQYTRVYNYHSSVMKVIHESKFPLNRPTTGNRQLQTTNVIRNTQLFGTLENHTLTRNCSKLRKIHSGQGPISLTINPSEFKFFGQFVLLWFEFSRCHLMSLPFLHMTSMTRDPYMLSRHAQNLFWWPENEIRQNEILITLEMCITVRS